MTNLQILRPGMLAEDPRTTPPIPGDRRPTTAAVSVSVPPAIRNEVVGFDPAIIQGLVRDHRQMLDLLQAADAYLNRCRVGQMRERLAALQSLLEVHFRVEFQHVYARLEGSSRTPDGRSPRDLIREEREQAQQIFAFFGRYLGAERRELLGEEFAAEFQRFSIELIEHTEREEGDIFPQLLSGL